MLVQADGATVLGQHAAVDERGAALGERTFAVVGKFVVERVGEDELQDRVAEKLQALVGLDVRARFVRDAGMREGEAEEFLVLERVTDPGLKCAQVRHGS